jgi:serine/threonine-protein kinase
VAGRTVTKAENLIVAAKLLVGPEIKQADETVKAGHVIRASPGEGTLVPPNTKVTLYVSTGPAKRQVPSVVGKSEQDATQALSQAGFNVGKITTDSTSTEPAGTVLQQSPGGGSQAKPGTSVNLTVSGGAVKVPSVVGESVTDAISSLSQAGLTYTIVTITQPGVPPGVVVSQTPGAGSAVPPQTQVTLKVTGSETPSPSPTPSSPTGSPSPSPSTPNGQGNSNPPSPSPSSSPHLRLTP